MAIKRISNNVINLINVLYAPVDKKYRDEEVESLFADLKNKGSIWEPSQVEPILFLDKKKKPWIRLLNFEKGTYGFVLYQNCLFEVTEDHSVEQIRLLVLEFVDEERKKFERLRAKFNSSINADIKFQRIPIPEDVRIFVWRRDQGRCARCGSKDNLEFDHIIPVSQGGSNTTRNIELLCEKCNRSKSDSIQ
jgi:hypothetical protein